MIAKEHRGLTHMQRMEERTGWLMVAPSLILLFVFMVVPAILSFTLAFTNQRLVPGPLPTRFVGFDNFIRLVHDKTFWQALGNNFYFTAAVVPLQCGLALLLAMLVNQKMAGMNVFRTVYFSPIAMTMAIVCIIWVLLLNPAGMINLILNRLTFGLVGELKWLADTRLAMPAILLVSIWASVGFQMVIFLAGLQDIRLELYEAAMLDGANAWQKFRYVTLPQLRNTTVFVLLTTTILAFRLFTQVEVITHGGPQGATNTVVRYMVETGYRMSRIGYASTITIVFLGIVLLISLLQQWIFPAERR